MEDQKFNQRGLHQPKRIEKEKPKNKLRKSEKRTPLTRAAKRMEK